MQHRPQLFYTTEPAPCPYLPNRMERKVLTDLSGPDAASCMTVFPRPGSDAAIRLPMPPSAWTAGPANRCACLWLFSGRPAQQRIWKRHQDVKAAITAPIPTQEQFVLFQAYQKSRHTDGDMAHMSWQDYADLISNTPVETIVIEFRTPADQLVCVSLIDVMSDGLSAVYTFTTPRPLLHPGEHSRSSGYFTWPNSADIFTSIWGIMSLAVRKWLTKPPSSLPRFFRVVTGPP